MISNYLQRLRRCAVPYTNRKKGRKGPRTPLRPSGRAGARKGAAGDAGIEE